MSEEEKARLHARVESQLLRVAVYDAGAGRGAAGASSSAAVNILPLARFLQEEMCHDEWRGATEHGMCCARHAYIPTYTSPFTT